jgi:hypothetical protein
MAASDDLQKYHCLCRAVLARANRQGLEFYCDRCQRRHLAPWEALKSKASFDRHWREWHAQERRS